MSERLLEYDVVIIGSGAGGGTVAKELASLGCRIALLEWGGRFRKEDNDRDEIGMAEKYYFDGGGFQTRGLDLTLAFARAVGGSTTVYTGTSLKAPRHVLEGWGVPGVTPEDLEPRFEKYIQENNVHLMARGELNENNTLFEGACRRLGWNVEQFPVNTRGCEGLATCNLGCARLAKQGTAVVQIPMAERQGVETITFCRADRIEGHDVVAEVFPPEHGLEASVLPPGRYRFRAAKIVVAGGSLNSAALLLRSFGDGLSPALGRYFTCHPAMILAGVHPRPIHGLSGHPKSFFCDEFAASNGFLLETCMYFPFTFAKSLAGFGADVDEMMARFDHLQMILVLAIDKAEARNRITLGRDGEPVVDYHFSERVLEALVASVKATAKLLFESGAEKVHAPGSGRFFIHRHEADRVDAWVQRARFKLGQVTLSAAHLMGGCRMGEDPAASVTDPWGRVHGHGHLYVADGSLFPDSVEINPYLTIMALADRVAEGIRGDLGEGSMKVAGAELIVKALQRAGVRWLFGIPGTHNIELYDALREAEGIEPVLITDEQSAGFMADGVARASGELAALNLVPGAGLTHALSGISECFLDQIPLLVLVCGIRKDTGRAYQLHAIDQAAIVRPVSKGVFQPATHAELYHAVLQACALAMRAPRGPAVVEVPAELYLFQGEAPGAAPAEEPAPEQAGDYDAVAAALNGAGKVGLYVGLGALEGREDLLELADRLDAVVFTTVSGKGVFPESHPRWAWNVLGRGAPAELRKLEEGCEALLAIGCRFGEVATASYGMAQPRMLIHVDADPSVFDRNVHATLTVQADAAAFLKGLLACGKLKPREADTARLGLLRTAHQAIRHAQAAPGQPDRVQPATLFAAVHRACGPETVFVADSGNGLFLAMEHLRLDHPRSFLGPVDYSCMGYSVPAAIGAKLARPDRPVAAFVGDGAFLMTGMEMLTAASRGAGVLFFLLRDRELSQIAQFQRVALGRQTCTVLGAYDACTLASGLGLETLKLDRDGDVEAAVRQAFAWSLQGRPVLVDVAIDYSKPTHFSKGVVVTNFLRLPWPDRVRMVSRVLKRKVLSAVGLSRPEAAGKAPIYNKSR